MGIEEVSFVNDVIQDNRANARLEQAYDLLIYQIFNNCKLNWNKDGLILKSDEKFFDLIELLEPQKYANKLKVLQNLDKKEEEEKEEE